MLFRSYFLASSSVLDYVYRLCIYTVLGSMHGLFVAAAIRLLHFVLVLDVCTWLQDTSKAQAFRRLGLHPRFPRLG